MTTHSIKPGTSSAYTLGTAFCGRGFANESAHTSIEPTCLECNKLYHAYMVEAAYEASRYVGNDRIVVADRFTALNKLSNVDLAKIINNNR